MTIETAQFIPQLNPAYPKQSDIIKEGDDHLRMIKNVVQQTFPNANKALSISSTYLNNFGNNLSFPDANTVLFNNGFTIAASKTIDMGGNRVQDVGHTTNASNIGTSALDAISMAALKATWRSLYPKGSVFCTGRSTIEPQNLPFFEGTTWEVFGSGRWISGVGVSTNGGYNMGTAATAGGTTAMSISTAQVPLHTHTVTVGSITNTDKTRTISTTGNHIHAGGILANGASRGTYQTGSDNSGDQHSYNTSNGGNHTHTFNFQHNHGKVTSSTTGKGSVFNFSPRYQALYFWKRTDSKGIWEGL